MSCRVVSCRVVLCCVVLCCVVLYAIKAVGVGKMLWLYKHSMTENNFDKLWMEIKIATKVVFESSTKDSVVEQRKAVMLLMYQCLSVCR